MQDLILIDEMKNMYNFSPIHSHPYWEILYYVKGEGIIFVGEQPFLFHEGDIFCLPPGIPHHEETQNGYQNIYFCVKYMDNFGSDIPIFHDSHSKDYLQLLKQLYNCYQKKEHNWKNLTDIIIQLLTEYMFAWNNNISRNPHVEMCKNTIIDNISNVDFSLTSLLNTIAFSNIYFVKLFKQQTGYTPARYLTIKRINRAKRLLTHNNSNFKIKDVAKMCGFHDPLYFSKVFKKITGSPPEKFEDKI